MSNEKVGVLGSQSFTPEVVLQNVMAEKPAEVVVIFSKPDGTLYIQTSAMEFRNIAYLIHWAQANVAHTMRTQ